MKRALDLAVPLTAMLLLVAVGLDLSPGDFVRVTRQRALILVGLLGPVVVLPPLAIGLASLLRADADLTAGVLVMAACPIGSIANTYCYLARASPAVSVTLSGLSCLCAAATIPLIGRGVQIAFGRPFVLEPPLGPLAAQLLIVLVLPVLVGMWARRRSEAAARHVAALQRLATLGIVLILAMVIANDPAGFVAGLPTAVPLVTLFVAASFLAGWAAAGLVTRDRHDRFAVATSFGARNVGIATAIAVTILGRVEFAGFAASYALIELPLMLLAVFAFRRL